MKTLLATVGWVLLASLVLPASHAAVEGPRGNPLEGLQQLKQYQTRRESSSDPDWRNGNDDRRPIGVGETITLAQLEGPGTIAHIWCTISHNAPFYARLLTLRIYWDGEDHPSVECPLGDFFGIGNGMDKPFISLPIRVSSEGRARNCYWPMPFRKSARITVSNDSHVPCRSIYYYIDWQKEKKLPPDIAYFHAMYRQEYPCTPGQNYLLADLQGEGHYVGTVQSVYAMSDLWYGEGDDFFFVDGEKEPSLRGTGTEDYFCDGWGFREMDGPFYGVPVWEGRNAGDRTTAYRFHVPDPVTFRKSLRVEIEHKGQQILPTGERVIFAERDDLMSSVAFWYQVEPHKPWPALPPGAERLPFTVATLLKATALKGPLSSGGGSLTNREFRLGRDLKQVLSLQGGPDGAWIEMPFQLETDSNYELVAEVVQTHAGGRYRVLLDGQQVGTVSCFAPQVSVFDQRLGFRWLLTGEHTLRFECMGKNIESEGYQLDLAALSARVPAYPGRKRP